MCWDYFSIIYRFLLFCGVLRCSKECLRGEQRLKITARWLAQYHFCWHQPFEKLAGTDTAGEGFTPGRAQQAWPASHYSQSSPLVSDYHSGFPQSLACGAVMMLGVTPQDPCQGIHARIRGSFLCTCGWAVHSCSLHPMASSCRFGLVSPMAFLYTSFDLRR